MVPAIVLFVITYILIFVLSKYRTYVVLASGAIFILTGMLPLSDIFSSIDFNVILMIIGTMGLVSLFTESKMPAMLADMVMEKVPDVKWAAVSLALFAGVISAFVDNVATVLMVAPIALAICKKLQVNPVPFIIAISVSSNLQGAATLVGDTTAIMLGSALDMSFLDFFWYKGRPSIFFAVELGAVLSALILLYIFRKENSAVPKNEERTKVTDLVPTILLVMVLVLLIAASFIPVKPDITNGAICCVLFLIGLVYTVIKKKIFSAVIEPLKEIDFQTIGTLVGIFLMIGGISSMGVIDALANMLAHSGEGNIFVLYTVIVFASVVISAFIDNIPYVATMIPVIAGIATTLNIDATPLYFGLLTGATLGGNCTPVGASANIAGIGILKKARYMVKSSDFFKIGIPFTIVAVVPAYIYIWIMYGI